MAQEITYPSFLELETVDGRLLLDEPSLKPTTYPNFERLEKLANHLLFGEIHLDVFNFAEIRKEYEHNIFADNEDDAWVKQCDNLTERIHSCGFAGCAIGELPALFPGEWTYTDFGYPKLKENRYYNVYVHTERFFNLCEDDCALLFAPNNLVIDEVRDERLKKDGFLPIWDKNLNEVSAYEVGYNILKYIQLYKDKVVNKNVPSLCELVSA
jgi:hypothetical protein